jgi:hypothetical protein
MPSIVERLRNDIDTNARHVAADYIEELEARIGALTNPAAARTPAAAADIPAPIAPEDGATAESE